MQERDLVSKFVDDLENGRKAFFFLRAADFYLEIGERTLEDALREKNSQKYANRERLQLWAIGGDGVGGIEF